MSTPAPSQSYADGTGATRAARRPDSPANPATPPAYPDDTSSTEIRRDISRTRTEMDSTLDQLGERLNPSNLIDDAADFAKGWLGFGTTSASAEPVVEERVLEDGTVVKIRREGAVRRSPVDALLGGTDVVKSGTRLAGTVLDSIRDNPTAAAICASGIAYAFFEDPVKKYARLKYRETFGPGAEPRRHSGSYVDARTGLPYDDSYGAGYRNPDRASGGSWSDAAGHWYDEAGNLIAQAGSGIANALSAAVDSVAGVFGSAADATGDAAASAGRSVASAGGSAKRYAANTTRDVTVKTGRVTDTATGALLHVGTEAKDGVYAAADTAADAAGNVTHRATGAVLYAGSAAAEAARSTGRGVKVTAGKVYDSTTGALLHAGSEVKDGAVSAAETFADAAGNVYDATTGAFLYAGSAAADAARSAGHAVTVSAGNAYHAVSGALLHAGVEVKDGTYQAADFVADSAGNLYHATTGALLSTGSAIADAVRSASSSLSHFAEDAYDTAGTFGHKALDTTVETYEATRDRFERGVQENPLAVGLGFLAAGLLTGFAVPRTRTENRLMGASRDRLLDQAEHSAEAVLHQAKKSAAEAMGLTLDEMERQGLTPKDLVDKAAALAKQSAAQIGSDISHAAKAQGLDPQGLKARAGAVAETALTAGKLAASETLDKASAEAGNVEGQAESEAAKLKKTAENQANQAVDTADRKVRELANKA